MNKLLIVFSLFVFILCAGCAAQSISEITTAPGYHKTITANVGYQQAVKIIKDSYAEMQGRNLSCTIYSDMQNGECTDTNAQGIFIFITAKRNTDNITTVEFYTALNTSMWVKKIDEIVFRLAPEKK